MSWARRKAEFLSGGERERGLLLWDATFAMKGKLLSKPSLHTWEKRDQTHGRYIFLYFK